MTALLETTGLTRRFGGLVAVDDLELKVEEGAIWAMIGPGRNSKSFGSRWRPAKPVPPVMALFMGSRAWRFQNDVQTANG